MPPPDILARAASASGPLATVLAAGKGGTGPGVICLAVSGTAITAAIPTNLAGKYVRVTASGASVDLVCGGLTLTTLVYGQTSSVGSTPYAITVNAATGDHFPDGVPCSFLMPHAGVATHMSAIASGNGKLYLALAEP